MNAVTLSNNTITKTKTGQNRQAKLGPFGNGSSFTKMLESEGTRNTAMDPIGHGHVPGMDDAMSRFDQCIEAAVSGARGIGMGSNCGIISRMAPAFFGPPLTEDEKADLSNNLSADDMQPNGNDDGTQFNTNVESDDGWGRKDDDGKGNESIYHPPTDPFPNVKNGNPFSGHEA